MVSVGREEEVRTKEEVKAKARAKTKAKEEERKDRKDSTNTRAVNKEVTPRNGTRTRTHGMKTVAQEDRVA